MPSMIKHAKKSKVNLTTFDSEGELIKMKEYFPDAQLLLRIAVDDKSSITPLSCKFGCEVTEGEYILKIAKELSLNVVGVAFHVGSGCQDPSTFYRAIQDSRTIFEVGRSLGFKMNLLDIGGGIPGKVYRGLTFEHMANQIKKGLTDHFTGWPDLRVIAEPGRYFVTTAFTMVTRVIGKKVTTDPRSQEKITRYCLNEGIYNCFYNIWLDDVVADPSNTLCLAEGDRKTFKSALFGPTCTGFDFISTDIQLPDLELGDLLIHLDMGAYTICMAPGEVSYGEFPKPKVYYFYN